MHFNVNLYFMIKFIKMGFDERDKKKAQVLMAQREAKETAEQEKLRLQQLAAEQEKAAEMKKATVVVDNFLFVSLVVVCWMLR